eukprot:4194416-Prorocentrum_lima.AAC.1
MHKHNILLLQETHSHHTDARLFNDGTYNVFRSSIPLHPNAGGVITLIKHTLFPGHWHQHDI